VAEVAEVAEIGLLVSCKDFPYLTLFTHLEITKNTATTMITVNLPRDHNIVSHQTSRKPQIVAHLNNKCDPEIGHLAA